MNTKNKNMFGQNPDYPKNIETEKALIGCLILKPLLIDKISVIIDDENAFFDVMHRAIYKTILNAHNKGSVYDTISIADQLKQEDTSEINWLYELTALSQTIGSTSNAEKYALLIKEKYFARLAMDKAQLIYKTAAAGDPFDAGGEAGNLADKIAGISMNTVQNGMSILNDTLNEIELISKNDGSLLGISTGFNKLDFITNGWQKSDLIILAARPSIGKTALVIQFILTALKSGEKVLFASAEMSVNSVMKRILSLTISEKHDDIRRGNISKDFYEKSGNLSFLENLFIDDSPGQTTAHIRATARRYKRLHDVSLVVVDYLQLLSATKSQLRTNMKTYEVGEMSKDLKNTAKEMNIPLILLTQLNRAADGMKPRLSHLKDSGQIEQDADMVLFIDRPDKRNEPNARQNLAIIDIAKHRNGATDEIELQFIGESMEFIEPAFQQYESQAPKAPNDNPF